MQVLYVEDDKLLAHSVEMRLRSKGYFCHITDLGEEAVILARRNRYDIIVLDIMLPDIDGYEVIERLRDEGIETPYLIQSGLLDRNHEPDGPSFGVEDFLIKPFSIGEMVARMEKTVARAETKAAAPPSYQPVAGRSLGPSGSDRREQRRFKTLKTARIVHDGARIPCVILNLSHGGAALRLTNRPSGPLTGFTLEQDAAQVRGCTVCWRYRDKIGVRFPEA